MDIKTCLANVGVEGIEVSGTIDKLYPRKNGTSEKWGDWSFQGLEISDGTGSIEVSLKNIPEMPQDKKGQQVTFKSVLVESQGKKMGVKIAERVPIIILACPDFASSQASNRSRSFNWECITAINTLKRR